MGLDFGPKEHLLQNKGKRSNWNPDGFFENYLFMDWSLCAFEKANSWGHIPPSLKHVTSLDFDFIERKAFIKESFCEIHDDRITNWHKFKLLRKYWPGNIDQYLNENFSNKIGVKNPHFSVLSSVLKKKWPESRFILCYRFPDNAIQSAKKIVPTANYDLYCSYYDDVLSLFPNDVMVISFDRLISQKESSLKSIAEALNLDVDFNAVQVIIKPELNRHQTNEKEMRKQWPENLEKTFSKLESLRIN